MRLSSPKCGFRFVPSCFRLREPVADEIVDLLDFEGPHRV